MNILDYIDWRGDITFAEKGLNEVDNLIFSTLVYLRMDGLVPDEGITVAALRSSCDEAGIEPTGLSNDPLPLLNKAAQSARFADVRVQWFVNTVDADEQIQFAAATFRYAEGMSYVAFRGTDNTIVGWREDMNLSFLSATPGQQTAADYISAVAERCPDSLIVGGHSKGGNFAVYGAAFCREAARGRITRVYSNDGPGFNHMIAQTPAYTAILPLTEKIIPESSLVGIHLSSRERRTIIRSSARGAMQHDPYSWIVLGGMFERADGRSSSSIFLDDTLNGWAATLSDEQLRVLSDTIFDSLEASGATTLREINENKRTTYNAIFKAIKTVDPDARSEVLDMLRALLETGKDNAIAETKRSFEKHREKDE